MEFDAKYYTLEQVEADTSIRVTFDWLNGEAKRLFRTTRTGDIEYESYVKRFEALFERVDDYELKRLYNIVKSQADYKGRFIFFAGTVYGIDFTDVDLERLPLNVKMNFQRCKFENTTIRNKIDEFGSINFRTIDYEIEFKSINLPEVNYGSWRNRRSLRLGNTPITLKTQLYLELGRECNANCKFKCRNLSFPKTEYNPNLIMQNLADVLPFLDSVVVAGGEPTLHLKELRSLRYKMHIENKHTRKRVDWYLFTNGSFSSHEESFYPKTYLGKFDSFYYFGGFKFNISRHAVADDENAEIFGMDEYKLWSHEDLRDMARINTTLCATCFEGGLNTPDKIEYYLEFAQGLGFKNVLLSSLMQDASLGEKFVLDDAKPADDDLFKNTIERLEKQGYMRQTPIYFSAGFCSQVLRHGNFTVSFKTHLTQKELDERWNKAIKRTFDLSMDPSGRLFENWHQKSDALKYNKGVWER
ncbi:hypothetical protein FACS189425_00410 [Clostridia bacterium]|nr:hypothetical protein FACS189425_00410 [Clostridia bacterium]